MQLDAGGFVALACIRCLLRVDNACGSPTLTRRAVFPNKEGLIPKLPDKGPVRSVACDEDWISDRCRLMVSPEDAASLEKMPLGG